jgi:hypothetical protein
MSDNRNPIRVFDGSLNLVTELDDYNSAYFTRSWSGCGDFSIQTNYNTIHAPDLQRGRIVMFDKNVYKCGIITNVKKEIGEDGKGSMIVTATGSELKSILGWRIVPPYSGLEYYSITDSAETVMKTLVSENGGPTDADADRKFSLLEIDTDAGAGDTYFLKTRWSSTVLAELTACSLATSLGFYIYIDLAAKKMRFATAVGTNRAGTQSVNPRAIFSSEYDTLKSANIEDNDTNYRNYAYIGGQGEGTARAISEVYTGAAEPTGIDRREMFVDARDLSSTTDLDYRGGQKLEELSTIITTDGAALAYSPIKYGRDYDLGDIATLVAYGVSRDVRITSVKESWAPTSYTIDLTFDKLPQTLQTQISSAVSSIKNTVNSSGATIIESGGTGAPGDAHWEKKGNGYAEIWGRAWPSTDSASSNSRYYNITLPINLVADKWKLSASSPTGSGIDHAIIQSDPTAGSKTAGVIRSYHITGTAATGYAYVSWEAEGLYE